MLMLSPLATIASEIEMNEAKTKEVRNIGKASLGDPSKEEIKDSAVIEGLGILKLKDLVRHPKFGVGEVVKILQYETGVQILQIEFEEFGFKSLAASHAKLERVE